VVDEPRVRVRVYFASRLDAMSWKIPIAVTYSSSMMPRRTTRQAICFERPFEGRIDQAIEMLQPVANRSLIRFHRVSPRMRITSPPRSESHLVG
jgi:hypothetical protein